MPVKLVLAKAENGNEGRTNGKNLDSCFRRNDNLLGCRYSERRCVGVHLIGDFENIVSCRSKFLGD